MPISVLTFTDINAYPAPALTDFSWTSAAALILGGVVGGDTALDTRDALTSYVEVSAASGGTAKVITCRPVLTPPIPVGATFPTDLPTVGADFDAFQMQVAFSFAPPMPALPNPPLAPAFSVATVTGTEVLRGTAEGRWFTDPAWANSWWDETDAGSAGGPPVFTTVTAVIAPAQVAAAANSGGHLVIVASPSIGSKALYISQIVGQITWESAGVNWHTAGGYFSTVGAAGLKILTPGRGWVDVVDGPA